MLFSWFSRISTPNRRRRSTQCPLRRRESRGRRMLALEPLEVRTLLSTVAAGFAAPTYVVRTDGVTPLAGAASPTGLGFTPTQIETAYGFNSISFIPTGSYNTTAGKGMTIAIVDAYNDPNIAADLATFDTAFSLPAPAKLTVVNETGGATLPGTDPSPKGDDWEIEESLDVEWAHSIAPQASILFVECNSASYTDLMAGANYAGSSGANVVSMSFGGGEPGGTTQSGYDKMFASYTGVTYVASTGDKGAPAAYPSTSPAVVAVGGTDLTLDGNNNWSSETGWSGSTGGPSAVETQQTYEKGVVPATMSLVGGKNMRTVPDVSYDADLGTGFPICDSYDFGAATPWIEVGGTSDAAPQWAAMIAIADQGRAANGAASLTGETQTLPILYEASASHYHDITVGTSTGTPNYSSKVGYDLVTGRGTPLANDVVNDMLGYQLTPTAPATATAGTSFQVTVTAYDPNDTTVDKTYAGEVHFASSDPNAVLPADATLKNGTATFTVTLKTAGSQTITVSDDSGSLLSGTSTLTVSPAATVASIGFVQQPTTTAVGQDISPAVTVDLYDAYGNVMTTDGTDTVSLALGAHPTGATLSGVTPPATVTAGVATFSSLSLNKVSNDYTLVATCTPKGGTSTYTVTSTNFGVGTPTLLDDFESVPTAMVDSVDLKLDSSQVPSGDIAEMNISVNGTQVNAATAPIQYNPANPAAFAALLQSDFANYNSGAGLFGGGETVTYNGRTGTIDDYTISTAGASNLTPVTSFTETPLVSPAPTGTYTQLSANAFVATVTSTPYLTSFVDLKLDSSQVPTNDNGEMTITVNSTTLATIVKYNPANPNAFATALQSDLRAFGGGGETVVYNSLESRGAGGSGATIDDYTITFAGASQITPITSFTEGQAISPAPSAPNVQYPASSFKATLVDSPYAVSPPNASTFSTVRMAAYNGAFGLLAAPGTDWLYRTDTTGSDTLGEVSQGDTLTAWLQFAGGTTNTRAYLGFGASSSGSAAAGTLAFQTLSLVASPATGQLLFQSDFTSEVKSGNTYSYVNTFSTIGTPAAVAWVAGPQWYRLEVDWSTTGAMTGELYLGASLTPTATIQVTASANTSGITSGGVAFRSTGLYSTYWDTVQVIHNVNSFSVAVASADPATATAGSPVGATVGTYDPAASVFYLMDSNSSGDADEAVAFGLPGAGWQPLNGDWTGSGTQTIGLYDPSASVFYLKNTDTSGLPDEEFQFGTPGANLIALVGDWNGMGEDTVGLYDPTTSTFYLKDSNSAGPADSVFTFGPANSGWIPVVGDWTGSGADSVGLYNPTTSTFYLKDSNTPGLSDQVVVLAQPDPGCVPVAGDWQGTGVSGVGLYDPTTTTFTLLNSVAANATTETVALTSATPGAVPSVSQWQAGQLPAASGASPQSSVVTSVATPLTQTELQPIVAAAIDRWQAAGASSSQIAAMNAVNFYIGNLPGNNLGMVASQNAIYLDAGAAGNGWFVDPAPQNDASFAISSTDGQLHAVNPAAVDAIDLLTVVEQELGHVIGLADSNSPSDVMNATLPVGVRYDVTAADVLSAPAAPLS